MLPVFGGATTIPDRDPVVIPHYRSGTGVGVTGNDTEREAGDAWDDGRILTAARDSAQVSRR